jgi:hypothetical protein
MFGFWGAGLGAGIKVPCARVARFCTLSGMSMHVPLPPGVRTATRVTDALIEESKAEHRGLILDQLLTILRTCEDEGQGDPRYLEIRLRTIDRLVRLLRLDVPQVAVSEVSGDGDRRDLVARAARTLEDLESRRQGA